MRGERRRQEWLKNNLRENRDCFYLKEFGSPQDMEAFRERLPLTDYNQLTSYIGAICEGKPDVLFAGHPAAFERTSGSSGGFKLIPYSASGLRDFRIVLSRCLKNVLTRFNITGSIYLSTTPVTRAPQLIGRVPVGVADADYLDPEMGRFVYQHSAVPFDLAKVQDIKAWKEKTLSFLAQAKNLQFISVWSPTFLISLLREVSDPAQLFPDLKTISCWTAGSSAFYASSVQGMFPNVEILPKGLMSTESVVTYNDLDGATVLNDNGFFEFIDDTGNILLPEELAVSSAYEVIITTASGLYRYRTGDMVVYQGENNLGNPVFDFIGRSGLVSDMVGEKIDEAFIAEIFKKLSINGLMYPDNDARRYCVLTQEALSADVMRRIEVGLCLNPQYAYARKLGQLGELKNVVINNYHAFVERELLRQGLRLGDIKHLALRKERFWKSVFEPKGMVA